jgi:hypothetical protein
MQLPGGGRFCSTEGAVAESGGMAPVIWATEAPLVAVNMANQVQLVRKNRFIFKFLN